MAETKRHSRIKIFSWLIAAIIVLALAMSGIYTFQAFKTAQAENLAHETLKTNAIKGKVWMERADKAHDANQHDKEFELLIKSASFDYLPAILKISKNYETGNFVHQSDLKAKEWAAKLPKPKYVHFLSRRGNALV